MTRTTLAHRQLLAGCLTSVIALSAGGALAQSASADADATVEAIIITATKREENLQDVPLAVSAVTEQDIKDAGYSRIEDIAVQVPNLTYSETTTKKITQLVVRGMSQSGGIGNDPNIGVYIDGVYIGRDSAFNMGLMDIARVEVLKGPQGTVFGRNSATGALSITTRKPSAEPSLTAEFTAGSYQLRRLGVTANGPLWETVLAKFTAVHTGRDGYLDNSFGGTANGIDNLFLRGQLLFTVRDNLDIVLSADFSRDRNNGNNYVTAAPGVPVNFDRQVAIPDLGFEDQDSSGVSATVEYGLGGGYTLTSISAYRAIETASLNDSDYSVLELGTISDARDQSQFSQELRITSPSGERFEWAGGLYYFTQDFTARTGIVSGRDTVFAFGCGFVNPFFCGKVGSGENPTDLGLPLDSTFINAAAGIDTTSFAVFASGSYEINDQWTLRGGLRYSRDEKKFAFTQDADPLSQMFGFRVMDCANPVFGCQTKRDDGEWQPMAALEYHASNDVMFYARISRGYTAGGFNANVNSGANPLSFGTETVDAYEIGFKSQFASNRVRLNAAVFSMDYTDKQESFFSAGAGGFIQGNAGGARSQGFEVELNAVLTDALEFNAAVGYADATYTDYGADTGNQLANAPDWQASASLQYRRPISEEVTLVARGDVFYQGDRYLGADNDPFFVFDNTTLVNARLGLESDDGRWAITAWARNLLDEESINQIFGGSSFFVPSYNYSPNNPRTFGVDLSLRY